MHGVATLSGQPPTAETIFFKKKEAAETIFVRTRGIRISKQPRTRFGKGFPRSLTPWQPRPQLPEPIRNRHPGLVFWSHHSASFSWHWFKKEWTGMKLLAMNSI
jgi:hypothetical protein